MKLEHEWDFVQMYYPDYDHSDDILENDILARLVDKEYVEDMDDSAYKKLVTDYNGDEGNPQIEIDYKLSCAYIFEEAIKGFIAANKEAEPVTEEDKGRVMASIMADFVNSFNTTKHDYFLLYMLNEHRTLQQSFTRLMLKWLEAVADEAYRYDDRNKAAHDVCSRMLERWKAAESSFIPHSSKEFAPHKWLPFI